LFGFLAIPQYRADETVRRYKIFLRMSWRILGRNIHFRKIFIAVLEIQICAWITLRSWALLERSPVVKPLDSSQHFKEPEGSLPLLPILSQTNPMHTIPS
jgi:hypothetical protein